MKLTRINPVVLFIPWILSLAFNFNNTLSYFIAWGGHLFLFYYTLSNIDFEPGKKLKDYVMQPIVINQVLFFSLSGLSSIFYFLDLNGYYYLTRDTFFTTDEMFIQTAVSGQRLYILGHAGMVSGIVYMAGKNKSIIQKWTIETKKSLSMFILIISGVSFVIYFILRNISGLAQVALMFDGLNLVAAILALSISIREKNLLVMTIAIVLFITNVFAAIFSGWKEQIFIPFLLLAFFLYQYYPRSVIFGMPIVIVFYFMYIPTFNTVFRQLLWQKGEDQNTAYDVALSATLAANTEEIGHNNWSFLTIRLSELNMLISYMDYIPNRADYYYLEIVKQSIINLIPRQLYPGKPITEMLVMDRVHKAGVVSKISNASAKPSFIADCYISGGVVGVALGTFILGVFMSFSVSRCEELFGGYLFGTSLIYNSFFNDLWRGNCFEFISTSIFWGTIIVYFTHRMGRYLNIIKPINP